jgi:hypothetical protein
MININTHSEEIFGRIHYWVPPAPDFEPLKKKLNTSLKIAAIVDERLYQGIRYEGNLFLLTPDNWEYVLKYGDIDFLLVESCWQTVTGHWYLGQSVHVENNEKLQKIISFAKKNAIPTVFWHTQDHLYHTHYNQFAVNFDYVFCADQVECHLLKKKGVKAEWLPPSIQPAIHNGFKQYDPTYSKFSINTLFDGYTDLYRIEDIIPILKELIPYGLKIIDSGAEMFSKKIDDMPLFKDLFLGSVTHNSRLAALKYAKTAITLEKTLRTKILQQWQTIETAACRLPVLHKGSIDPCDIRHGLVSDFERTDDLLLMLTSFLKDDLYRQRMAHLSWREIYQKHTFANRLSKICNSLKITHDYDEFPLMSVVTPTFREEKYSRCIETFQKQKYPNKEMILVVNNNDEDIKCHPVLKSLPENVHVHFLPQDKFAGGALNFGNTVAKGQYCLRMDDDDYYGENYLSDIALHLKAVDADVFGSPACYYMFEREQEIFQRKIEPSYLQVAKPKDYGQVANLKEYGVYWWISGNTIGINSQFFEKEKYPEMIYGAADAAFTHNIKEKIDYFLLFDQFNMIASRSDNVMKHTWRISEDELKNKMLPPNDLDFNDIFI